MQPRSKRITKEQYDRARQNGGYIIREDEDKIFTTAELLGYGVYSPIVHESGDGYYVHYYIGSSCD